MCLDHLLLSALLITSLKIDEEIKVDGYEEKAWVKDIVVISVTSRTKGDHIVFVPERLKRYQLFLLDLWKLWYVNRDKIE